MSTLWRSNDHNGDEPAFADGPVAAFPQPDPGADVFGADDSGFGDFGAFEPGAFATGAFEPGADQSDDGFGSGLVVAPMPALPTRWDALDARPHAPEQFDEAAFTDEPAFTHEPAFTPEPAFAHEPDLGLVVEISASLATAPLTLIEELQRVCLRLLGRRQVAFAVARQALDAATSPQAPTGDPLTALVTAVRLCLQTDLPDEERIPYHQHRARLRRDLGRRPDQDRAVLAMRHLLVVPPSGVAARLGVPESQVREAASAWCPEDSRVDSLALLRGIDSWISSDLGTFVSATTGTELDHLDDVID